MSSTKRLTKAFSDAIPLGPHPAPHAEWILVRLDFIQEAIDHMDWLEKGNAEWRSNYQTTARHAEMAMGTGRIAIKHLAKILDGCRTHSEQQQADTDGREFLKSIGAI